MKTMQDYTIYCTPEQTKLLREQREIADDVSICKVGAYFVTSNGRVFSDRYNKELKQETTNKGYLRVHLLRNGSDTRISVHRLIAECFIPNPDNKPQVNHIDGNKQNNDVSNLEWCTKAYNNSYGTRIERMSRKVIGIDIDGKETIYKSIREASRITKTATCNIRNCANNKVLTDTKGNRYNCITAGGYKWKWYD